MPSLSKKSSASFTFARSPHQQRFAQIPRGKLASFFFFYGLKSRFEQGTLMATKNWFEEIGKKYRYFKTTRQFNFFIERQRDQLAGKKLTGEG
jgi:hypothetical protein